MAFVNEKISESDVENYGLLKINKQFLVNDLPVEWTIDRDKKVYLRALGKQPQEQQALSFCWRGHMLYLRLTRTGCGIKSGTIFANFCIMSGKTNKKVWLPPRLEWARNEIVVDLKKALNVYKSKDVQKDTKHLIQFVF
jgi:hypothetical protein